MEQLPERQQKRQPLSSREYLWKTLKPVGCIFVLVLAAVALVLCFTAGTDPIKGYSAPEDTAYYAAHPEALYAELQENVLPHLQGIVDCGLSPDGRVTVSVAYADFVAARSALLRYFDESLLDLVQLPGT